MADWDAHDESTPVTYTEIVTSSQISSAFPGYFGINFVDDGLDAMRELENLQMVCLEATYDYTRTTPDLGTEISSNFYQDEEPENTGGYSTIQPKLFYTMGYTNNIMSGNINIKSGKVTIK